MAPLSGQLVGRASELAVLDRVLDEVDRKRPGAVVVSGEPGIGKTRLLRELATRADSRGYLVLTGAASEFERDYPFSAFVDALDEYLAGIDPKKLAALNEDAQAELGHVFPSLAPLGRGRPVALQQERHQSHHAVRGLLEQLARPRPLILVLDDLQWADAASVELIAMLLRRPPAAAVLIALATRPRRAPQRLATALDRAQRDGSLARIDLGPLSQSEVHAFLGDEVGAAWAAAVYQESGGNPFFVGELVRALSATGKPSSGRPGVSSVVGVPQAVAVALAEEIASASERSRLVLQGAAVGGDPFELDLATAASGVSAESAIDSIDELLALDLIRPTDVPRRFAFRHPLVRRAVYEATPAGWRLSAHARCAEALAQSGASATARAHHVERSAGVGDAGAIAVLREAGDAALRLAPASAERWFSGALRLLPQNAPDEERIALLMARAGARTAIEQLNESRVDLLECIELARSGAPDWRVRATTACAAVEHLLGRETNAHDHLLAALADLKGEESAEAVELMIELTVDGFHRGDFEAMRSWAERAVGAAEPLGDRALLASALAIRAWYASIAGDSNRAPALLDEVAHLVDELSDAELGPRIGALAYLNSAELFLDRYAACTRHARRALDICRATGQGESFPLIVAMLGSSLWVQGRIAEAGEVFDGAIESARLAGNAQNLAWNLFNRSFAALVAGDVDLALATGRESYELEAALEPGPLSASAAAVYASALFEAGEADKSIELILNRAGGLELPLIGGGWRARFLEVLTRALLATGRRDEAERAAQAARAAADSVALPTAHAFADLAQAAVELDAGSAGAASERALAAAATFESVTALFDAARAREQAGRALAQAGEREGGAAQLELAAAAFDAFGAFRYRDQAERELRKLGRHIGRRTRPGAGDGFGVGSLTERELQVARLVVDRRTNNEIAAELFLSQKTVETHMRNIFNKLGVAQRAAVARAVEQADRARSSV